MTSKTAEELMCESCGAEYTVTYDSDNITDEIIYCPFCGSELDSYTDGEQGELDFDDD